MKRIVLSVIISAVTVAFSGNVHAASFKEGQWSMTTVVHMEGIDEQMAEAAKEMENMSPEEKAMMQQMMGGMGVQMGVGPGGGGMSMTMTKCLTNEDPVPETSDEEGCQSTHNLKGNTLHFETTCKNSHSTGEIVYKGSSMKGTIQSVTTESGTEQKATIDISGEYVGPCDEKAAELDTNGLAAREMAIREKELEIRGKELELQSASQKDKRPSTLNDVNSAVDTSNEVKNTLSGLRSLFGR